MTRSMVYTLAGIGGGVVGYFILCIYANSEDWMFYSMRSYFSGRTAMSELSEHPIDRWVTPVLIVSFVNGGATIGVLMARWLTNSRAADAEK